MIEHILFLSKLGKCCFYKGYSDLEILALDTFSNNILKLILNNIDSNIVYDIDINSIAEIENKDKKNVKNIYNRYYNGVFVVLICDSLENELAIIDFINLLISIIDEALNKFDDKIILLNLEKVHAILDEIIVSGVVVDLDTSEILKNFKETMSN